MNCLYCNKSLSLSHKEDKDLIFVFNCLNCPILVYYYFSNKKLIKMSFMIYYQTNIYCWTNNFVKQTSYIYSSNSLDPKLLSLPQLVELNPNNIKDKLTFYLTFI